MFAVQAPLIVQADFHVSGVNYPAELDQIAFLAARDGLDWD